MGLAGLAGWVWRSLRSEVRRVVSGASLETPQRFSEVGGLGAVGSGELAGLAIAKMSSLGSGLRSEAVGSDAVGSGGSGLRSWVCRL